MRFIEIIDQEKLDEFSNHIDDGKKAFVLVYMNNCGHCEQVKPKWFELKERMHEFENKENIVIAHVEMSVIKQNQTKINFGSIDGFPHIVHIYKKNTPMPYENSKYIGPTDRSTESFIRWIKKHAKNRNSTGFEGGGRRKRRTKRRKHKRTRQSKKNRRTKRKT